MHVSFAARILDLIPCSSAAVFLFADDGNRCSLGQACHTAVLCSRSAADIDIIAVNCTLLRFRCCSAACITAVSGFIDGHIVRMHVTFAAVELHFIPCSTITVFCFTCNFNRCVQWQCRDNTVLCSRSAADINRTCIDFRRFLRIGCLTAVVAVITRITDGYIVCFHKAFDFFIFHFIPQSTVTVICLTDDSHFFILGSHCDNREVCPCSAADIDAGSIDNALLIYRCDTAVFFFNDFNISTGHITGHTFNGNPVPQITGTVTALSCDRYIFTILKRYLRTVAPCKITLICSHAVSHIQIRSSDVNSSLSGEVLNFTVACINIPLSLSGGWENSNTCNAFLRIVSE